MTAVFRSNSAAEVDRLVERVRFSISRAVRSGRESLEAFRDAGRALCAMKALLPPGRFGEIAEARCKFSKAWRARLMKLNIEWPNVVAAHRWAQGLGRMLGRREYSVDGALALAREHRRVLSGARPAASSRPRPSSAKASDSSRIIAELRQKLVAQAIYAAELERELAQLRPAPTNPQPISAELKTKVIKIAAHWLRGANDGERSNALRMLRAAARQRGWQFLAFLDECGLRSLVHFTSDA